MARAVEAAYIRFILDPLYESSIRSGNDPHHNLDASALSSLKNIEAETIEIERRGRWFSLWQRAKAQMPFTVARLENHCVPGKLPELWKEYFAQEFWSFQSTLDIFPYGKGMEVASTLRDYIYRKASETDEAEWKLCRDLAELEWQRFRINTAEPLEGNLVGKGQSHFWLFNAVSQPKLAADSFATESPLHWGVYRDGSADPLPENLLNASAVTIHPNVVVRIESFRLNRFHDSSTLYYTLGEEIDKIKTELNDLNQDYQNNRLPSQEGCTEFFQYNENCCQLLDKYYFRETPDLLDEDTDLVFKLKNTDEELRVPLNRDRLDFFRRLLPQLRPQFSFQQTLESLNESERSFVGQLLDVGYLQPLSPQVSESPKDISIKFVGHSCLLIESTTTRIVVDPLLTLRGRPNLDLLDLLNKRLDAVVVSHPHWDHFNLDSLLHVPMATPILIPEQRHKRSIVNLDMQKVCEDLGFSNIRQCPYWEGITIGDITIRALPYFGENSGPHARRDWMTYHIEVAGKSIVGLVDSCHNQVGDMDTVLLELRERLGTPDILFAPSSGFYYSLSSYTRKPFYLGRGTEQYTGTPRDLSRWATITGAKMTIPYANFHFTQEDVHTDHDAMLKDEFRHGSIQDLPNYLECFPEGPLAILTPGDTLTWTPSSEIQWKRGPHD